MTTPTHTYAKPDFAHDADLTHPWAVRYRIPVLTELPQWNYEVALIVPPAEPREWDRLKAIWPTEEEAEVIGSYIDYRRAWYREDLAARKLQRPLDVDAGTNTVTLVKTENGWRYQRATWTMHGFWPLLNQPEFQATYTPDKAGLIALINKDNTFGDNLYHRMVDHQAQRPDTWNLT